MFIYPCNSSHVCFVKFPEFKNDSTIQPRPIRHSANSAKMEIYSCKYKHKRISDRKQIM